MKSTSEPPKRGLALIADDELSNRVILKALVKKMGYEVVQAVDGAQAVMLFTAERPNLVFMDVMMPVMDGYEATREIKALSGDSFIPVIFLTAITDESALARCIEVGGDDFLTKPYSHTMLAAKVQAMERFQALHYDIRALYSRMHRDEEIAEQVFSNAVVAGNVALDQIRTLLRPASVFSGDLLLTAYSPSQDLHILLGDFTGHGLSAALGALPASEVFRSMTAKGFSPPQILQAINNKLYGLLPTGMFMAVQFVKVSRNLDHISTFNCGMPDFYLLDGKTHEIIRTIQSHCLPLGITSDVNFADDLQYIPVSSGERIILATDGATEARNPHGEYFGIERFSQAISTSGEFEYSLQWVEKALEVFCQDAPQDDDISLAEIPLCPQLLPAWDTHRPVLAENEEAADEILDFDSDSIEFQVALHGGQLRRADPVPMLINYLQESAGLHEHRQPLFTILTELFVNALDHGVLGLDSSLKEGVDGFTRFFEHREELLQKLADGFIRIGVRIHPLERGGFIVIQIEDSGKGFDLKNRNQSTQDNQLFSGRGIALLEGLCESVSYIEPGNKATAVYRWMS